MSTPSASRTVWRRRDEQSLQGERRIETAMKVARGLQTLLFVAIKGVVTPPSAPRRAHRSVSRG
jgi:hypothetical protein